MFGQDDSVLCDLSCTATGGGQQFAGLSPKKKQRSHTFKLFGKGNGGGVGENADNVAPSIFQMSQTDLSQGFSQSSQASFIGNYLGQMEIGTGGMDESFSDGPREEKSVAPQHQFQLPLPRIFESKNSSEAAMEKERQISLPTAIVNPFLTCSGDNTRGPAKAQLMWVSAFRSWPRFQYDFETQGILGEGVQSVVYCAKRRVDGCYYAVKKLKRQILSEKEGSLLTKESCALAAFSGCPHLLQYFSSWIEDGFLYIQTELCPLGSLETLVEARFDSGLGAGPPQKPTLDHARQQFGGGESVISFSQIPLSQIDNNPLSQIQLTQEEDGVFGGQGVPEAVVWLLLAQISQALAFLHSKKVAHLDVRPANIFVASSFDPVVAAEHQDDEIVKQDLDTLLQSVPYQVAPSPTLMSQALLRGFAILKLGDLGQCCSLDSSDFIEGESRYCPREVINGDLKNVDLGKSDIFSLAATCYELARGRRLDASTLEWHALRDGVLSDYFQQNYSPQLVEALRVMMHPSPSQRPTALQVFNVARVRLDELKRKI